MGWDELVRSLVAHRDGAPVNNPLHAPRSGRVANILGPPTVVRWYAKKWAVLLWIYLASMALLVGSVYFAESGRTHIQTFATALLVWCSSFI